MPSDESAVELSQVTAVDPDLGVKQSPVADTLIVDSRGWDDSSEPRREIEGIEHDALDDAVPYQVMKAEHPPDSEQAKALEGVMCQLVEEAEAETGEPHRLVTEVDTPAVTQRHYEMHEERIEGETLVTDGGRDTAEAEIPRTDICEECEREIVPEVKHIEGQHEIIHRARTAEEGFMSVTAGKAEIRFKCACSSVTVEFGPGSATAWDVPDAWMWEDNVDVGEEVLPS